MRTLLALTPLLLIASTLHAQTPAAVTVLQAPSTGNCPIGVTAQHSPQGAVEEIGSSAKHHELGYNIGLSTFDSSLIRQAQVTLHGTTGGFLPAASHKHNTDVTESFTLTPGDSPKPKFQSVIYAKKLTGVNWIQVNEVTYADGTQWHQTAGSSCGVTPNGFLLVNITSAKP